MNGLGFIVALMCILIVGFILRSTWTSIMNRADAILLCCPDKSDNGIHVVTKHYHPGGESESLYTFSHYYIVLSSGKAFLSKKVGDGGHDITESLIDLAKKTKIQLHPDKTNAIRIGSNMKESVPTCVNTKVGNGVLDVRGYEGLIDYGFKLKFAVPSGKHWKMRL